MKRIKLGCRLISVLMVLTLIVGWKNFLIPLQLAFRQSEISHWSIFLVTIGLLFLCLNLLAAIGLYFIKGWGFPATYIAIIFSSIFFSSCYLPFINKIFPMQFHFIFMMICNLMVLVSVGYLQFTARHYHKAQITRPPS